jgi:hypothetical protein
LSIKHRVVFPLRRGVLGTVELAVGTIRRPVALRGDFEYRVWLCAVPRHRSEIVVLKIGLPEALTEVPDRWDSEDTSASRPMNPSTLNANRIEPVTISAVPDEPPRRGAG